MRSWYDVLGVAPDASPGELRARYREQVLALHPDTRAPDLHTADADAALRLVNEAWAVLGDPVRRADYDVGLEESPFGAEEGTWDGARFHGRTQLPWWILVLAVLLVIFVFTAYAGAPVRPR